MLLRVAIFVCCLGASTTSWADVFDVYLASGQSNMDGRAYTKELVGPLTEYRVPQPNVLIHYTNPGKDDGSHAFQAGWTALVPGYAVKPGYSGPLPSQHFGPEVSFGKAMAENYGRRLAILKVSRGATNLRDKWDPSDTPDDPKGHMYAGFLKAVPAALAQLRSQGHSAEIRGMIWHQGEGDISFGQAAYEANLAEFIHAVRNDLDYPNLPFLVGEIESVGGDRESVRSAQRAVAAAMDFVEFVPSTGLAVYDGTHFTTAAVVELGQRFAATMKTTISTLPGDFNRDGRVNGDDREVWQAHEGSKLDARADANDDGIVDEADLEIWRKMSTQKPSE